MGVAGRLLPQESANVWAGLFLLCISFCPIKSRLGLVATRLEFKPIFKACTNGASELMSNISASLVGMLYNFQLLKFAGENGVSAYGVLMYTQFILWRYCSAIP